MRVGRAGRCLAAAALGTVLAAVAAVGPLAGAAAASEYLTVDLAPTTVDGSRATVSGTASMADDPTDVLDIDRISGVHIEVRSQANGTASNDACDDDGCGAQLGKNTATFSFRSKSFAYNGRYDVVVTVRGERLGIVGEPTVSTTVDRKAAFKVEVKPAPPADVKTTVNPDRTVTVSWARNSEPDLVGYQVQRRPVGSDFMPISPGIAQPADGPRVEFVDRTAGAAGGTFEYAVVAVRPDGDGAITLRTMSRSTATAPVTVPGGTILLPSIKPGGPAVKVAPAAPRTAPEVDNGFASTLPYGAAPGDASGVAAANGNPVVLANNDAADRRALLLPIAAGLFLCVAAFHLRWLNGRARHAAATTPYLPLPRSPERSTRPPANRSPNRSTRPPANRPERVLVGRGHGPDGSR